MHQSQEQIKPPVNESLETCKQEVIEFTPEELAKIKENIDAIINRNEKNISALTNIANTWGALPRWLKALIFIIILIPTIVTLVLTQTIWIILTVAAINALFALLYVGISLLFDNHFTLFKETKEELKAIMDGMADFLGSIISSLQGIAHALGFEVERFKVENGKLAINVDEFSVQNDELKTQVIFFSEKTKELGGINEGIKENAEKLEKTVLNQEALLEKHKQLQEDMQIEHAKHLSQLQTQISQLTQINGDLAKELDTAQVVVKTLMETNASLIEINVDFDKSRAAFVSQASGFFDEKNEKLNTAVDGFSNTVAHLQTTTDLFRQSIEEQNALCKLDKENKNRLEKLNASHRQDRLLMGHGVFKTPNQPIITVVENPESSLN